MLVGISLVLGVVFIVDYWGTLVLGTVLCLLVYYWGTLALVTRRTEGDGTSVRAKPPPNGLQRSKQPLLENSDGSSLRHGALTLIHRSQFLNFHSAHLRIECRS